MRYLSQYINLIDNLIKEFVFILKQSADQSIPINKNTTRTNKNISHKISWWNDECKSIIKKAKQTFNKYKKHRILENLIIFKK